MKREELDELEGKQLDKSWKMPRNVNVNVNANCDTDAMDANMLAVMEKLTPEQQERAKNLWEELVDLKVRPGLRNRLMAMGKMGAMNHPIWKYIYKLRTGAAKKVRDRGGWLVKCLMNDKLKYGNNQVITA